MSVPAALPAFDELRAPNAWKVIDFISDLHLSDATPRTLDAWALSMRSSSADALIILGDLFEVWVGDDSRHTGFEVRCAEVLKAAAAGRYVAFMAGNRDFLVGAEMLAACGVHHLVDPTVLVTVTERLLLTHGDALCLADVEYQRFREWVRSPAWRTEFLALPLPERRRRARQIRDASEQRKAEQTVERWFDVDAAAAVAWMEATNAPTLIHGHTHRPTTEGLAPGRLRHVLSDWDLDHAGAPRGQVLRWQAGGVTRLPLPP